MPSRESRLLGNEYVATVSAINRTRRRVDELRSTGTITRADADRFYQGLFLSLYTSFEDLLEELFVGLLVADKGYFGSSNTVQTRITVKSHAVARDVIVGAQPYMSWLPFDRTERLAKAYFRNGSPFTELDQVDKDLLTACQQIRNALAHRSRSAQAKFERTVLRNVSLPMRERTPVGFLQGIFRTAPAQTRFENYSASLLRIVRKLTG